MKHINNFIKAAWELFKEWFGLLAIILGVVFIVYGVFLIWNIGISFLVFGVISTILGVLYNRYGA